MRKNSASVAALPIIEVIKVGKLFEVHWDYQEAPESSILSRKYDLLSAFIDGVLVGMGIPSKNVACASAEAGAVKSLDESTASRLAQVITAKLGAYVQEEHRRLSNAALHDRLCQGLEK